MFSYNTSIHTATKLLTYVVNELSEQYDVPIDAVLFSKRNILHPFVISPKDFINNLRGNIKLLREGKSFPFTLSDDNAAKLFESSNLNVFYSKKIIIFCSQNSINR